MSSVIFLLSVVCFSLVYLSGVGARDTKTWCDSILGCLELTDEWYSLARPINVLPDSREKINTRFILQTREEPGSEENVYIDADDLSTITYTTFSATRPTKFIIHGYMDNGDKKWMINFAASLLGHGDYNVIRVDWGDGSMYNYIGACANIRVVGLEIAHLVNTLIQLNNLDPTSVHLIGHSLGSHAGGYAGEGITNLGRITGLDPAGPFFTYTDPFIRLDPRDANFVDNIHTDSDSICLLGYGTKQPMGNLDFYPNGGHKQPGCSVLVAGWFWKWINGPRDMFTCNHQRAINFFEETLLGNTCEWLSHECIDNYSFQRGLCTTCGADNSRCAFLGIKADQYAAPERELVQLYINTNDRPLFCRIHYVLEVLTDAHDKAEDTVVGNLRITLYGSDGGIVDMGRITGKHEKIDHGSLVRYLFITDEEIGNALTVTLEWNYNDTIYPGTYCMNLICNRSLYVKSIQVSPGTVYPESLRVSTTFVGCRSNGETTEMTDGKINTFRKFDDCAAVIE